jgi:hypothetical protein
VLQILKDEAVDQIPSLTVWCRAPSRINDSQGRERRSFGA